MSGAGSIRSEYYQDVVYLLSSENTGRPQGHSLRPWGRLALADGTASLGVGPEVRVIREIMEQCRTSVTCQSVKPLEIVYIRDSSTVVGFEPVSEKPDDLLLLLQEWMDDRSGYDERVWPIVRQAIEGDRLSSRDRFSE